MSKSIVLLGALLFTTAAAAEGQTLGSLSWVGTGDSFHTVFQKTNGSQVSAYAGAAYKAMAGLPQDAPWYLQTSNGFGPAVDILCIDFLHTARQQTYSAYFTNLAHDNLTKTRGKDIVTYQQVAWLSTEMEVLPFNTLAARQKRAEIHAAIWQLLSGQPQYARAAGGSYSGSGSMIAGWIYQAGLQQNYTKANLSQFTVVTAECVSAMGQAGQGFATSDNCGQEFLVRDSTVTPEPGTILLLATGLMAVVGMSIVGRGGVGV